MVLRLRAIERNYEAKEEGEGGTETLYKETYLRNSKLGMFEF